MAKRHKHHFYYFWRAEWDGKNAWTVVVQAHLDNDRYHAITQTVAGGKRKGLHQLTRRMIKQATAEYRTILRNLEDGVAPLPDMFHDCDNRCWESQDGTKAHADMCRAFGVIAQICMVDTKAVA